MNMTRKQFIQSTATGVLGATFVPGRVWGANDRLNIACIGIGGRGGLLARTLGSKSDSVNLLAFADIDKKRSEGVARAFSGVPLYHDFREMIAKHKTELDGVTVGTPDHVHHYIAKYCLKEGLPVYVEKPLAHSVRETKDLTDMERKTGLACQMGNQGHSSYAPYVAKEWMKAGILGDVGEVHAWTTHRGYVPYDTPAPKQEMPGNLDWDAWLGPAPYRDYNACYCPGKWRNWNQFGEGMLGDMGAHCMDVPYYVLDLKYPEEILPESSSPIYKESFPESMKVTYRFPRSEDRGPVTLTWYHGRDSKIPRPSGFEDGRTLGSRHGGSYMVGSEETLMAGSHGTPIQIIPGARYKALAPKLKSIMAKWKIDVAKDKNHNSYNGDHMENWLNAIRGRGTCNSNFEYAGHLTNVLLLGNIATFLDTPLKVNPDTGDIIGNPAATELARGPAPREAWRI